MSEEFLADWFGPHAGREALVLEPYKERLFLEKPSELCNYVQQCTERKLPAFLSVQPYSARNQPFGLEKLFFETDSENLAKAWKDTKILAETLNRYYAVTPFIKFSGRKGYHTDVFFRRTVQFPTWRTEFVKAVYDKLQRKILKGLQLETLDVAVLGDLKRLERIPFSVHEATGNMCVPVDLKQTPVSVECLEPYRENGLNTKILEGICKEVAAEEKWRRVLSEKRRRFPLNHDGEVRPCLQAALSLPLHTGGGHKLRLAIAVEHLHKGASVDQAVDLFRSQVDFDEKKTKYFVSDAQKKGYKPFKCKTIRSLGFCLKDECPIYVRRRKK